MSEPVLEHLSGEQAYRVVSVIDARHRRSGRGLTRRRGALTTTVAATGLGQALSAALARWRHPNAIHDPGKIVCDLAIALALGGDCLADIATLRAEPASSA